MSSTSAVDTSIQAVSAGTTAGAASWKANRRGGWITCGFPGWRFGTAPAWRRLQDCSSGHRLAQEVCTEKCAQSARNCVQICWSGQSCRNIFIPGSYNCTELRPLIRRGRAPTSRRNARQTWALSRALDGIRCGFRKTGKMGRGGSRLPRAPSSPSEPSPAPGGALRSLRSPFGRTLFVSVRGGGVSRHDPRA